MFETIACGHELCNCVIMAAVGDIQYCSDDCRNAVENDIESDACPCGHPPCDAA
ncbi:MAG: hypothetical protein M1314_03610 [Firmicutes bacterium]|jgi:hypothetical protein|nr:hypothetical protein [Bacillota bacterium]